MTSPYTVSFRSPGSTAHDLVGGKGANLGHLATAGFNVPTGFTVTTEAYRIFLRDSGLGAEVTDYLARIDYTDLDGLEKFTSELRGHLLAATVPADIARAITTDYSELGADTFVAVRSSGTAEDLAEASFAGQHDTYLDIQGVDGVLDAVKRCWASLWTARATAYRNKNGIDHASVAIAVVVQTMVPSQVSGVLFTGNPMTTATDEMVINASWGLGEAIVSGITQPDEFTLDSDTLTVRDKRLGEKTVQVIRDPAAGVGTAEAEVPAAQRDRFCLDDTEVAQLGRLGRDVTGFYEGIPQDIEWAFVGGELFLLQSRPITGVAFSWDEQVEPWQTHVQRDAVWSRAWADTYWGGGATPLFYSWRGRSYTASLAQPMRAYGVKAVEGVQWYKYYKGVGYYNGEADALAFQEAMPKTFREAILTCVTPQARDAALAAPFSLKAFARWHIGSTTNPNFNVLAFLDARLKQVHGDTTFVDGLPEEELRKLSDQALVRHNQALVEFEFEYCVNTMPAIWNCSYLFGGLTLLLDKWYSGDAMATVAELVTGTPQRTASVTESLWLWDLAKKLRGSPALRAAFDEHEHGAFFAALEDSEEGRVWLKDYHEFATANAHRGHADRDIIYPRRSEDPSIDYNSLKAFLSTSEDQDPEAAEHQVNRRREAAVERVTADLRQAFLGGAKVEAFKFLYNQVMKSIIWRDDERHYIDRATMSIKRSFLEISRRLVERGAFEDPSDVYFLGEQELYDLFRSGGGTRLAKAKIAARRANFEAVSSRSVTRPAYIQHYKPLNLGAADIDDSHGLMQGSGTAPGTVTGRARVVKQLKDIGQLKGGEILICNSTDPGWTPVFLVISGIVIETGGLLAHASCLAREYGFPAIQLSSAMDRIPDGALITVDGNTGVVSIEDESEEAAA